MDTFNIAQITDLHITRPNEDAYGVDVKRNFHAIIRSIKQDTTINHLVITGDLCFRECDASVYRWVRNELETSGINYSIIPGNHDDTKLLKKEFTVFSDLIPQQGIYYSKEFGTLAALFLDTSKKKIDPDQLIWIENQLIKLAEKDVIIFMHHPPIFANVIHMDTNHALEDQPLLMNLLHQQQKSFHIFCGHYHTSKALKEKKVNIHITPSGFFQINEQSEKFKIDSYEVGWRKVSYSKGSIKTSVIKVPAGLLIE